MKPQQVKFDKEGSPILPKTEAAVVDLLYESEQLRYKIQREVERLKTIEAACDAFLVEHTDLKERIGGSGKVARFEIELVRVPQVDDWDKYWAYAKKNNAPEMFERRPGRKAIQDRWDAGKTVPGVSGITVKKVHVYKLKRGKK